MSVPFKYHEVLEYSIIEYESLPSTNQKLYQQAIKGAKDKTVVWTKHQTAGKGYYGNNWHSGTNTNLSFSVLHRQTLPIDKMHFLSMATAISVCDFLKSYDIEAKAKWPNDIISDDHKLSGVLIENKFNFDALQFSVIGIGINVNQIKFDSNLKATSMQILSGKAYDLDETLNRFLVSLSVNIQLLNDKKYDVIERKYIDVLYKYKEEATYKIGDKLVSGILEGIDKIGQAKISINGSEPKVFKHKEISLVYP